MATDVIMPALGMAQEKGILVQWLKAEGESVAKGEPLMEVETDKATVEIEAPASGVLANITADEGDEVPVGETIAVILAPGEAPAEKPASAPALRAPEAARDDPAPEPKESVEPRTAPSSGEGTTRLLASPAAKRIAREKGVDIASLRGTGPGGSVVAEDVLRAAEAETPPPPVSPPSAEALTPMRRIVGERMTRSKQSAPHFYVSMEVDMTEVGKARARWKEEGKTPVPSINDFVLHACARALKDFPSLNSAFTGAGIHHFTEIHIGMAVALEEGLVVPVIRNADRLDLESLARQSRELAEKAQRKKLFPLDYEGGTFTVSNLGMFGVDSFVAIINPPQCAILALGQAAPRVVPHGEDVAIRSMMTMTLSADHRIVDGAIAARFLQEVKRLLERAGV